jgi:DNA polymerase I
MTPSLQEGFDRGFESLARYHFMPRFYFDTETFPIRPSLLAPKLVCMQWAYENEAPQINLREQLEGCQPAAGILVPMLEDPAILFVGHNQAFDLAVLAAEDEGLVQPIFRMLAEKRGRDTQIRETLKCIADGTLDFRRKQKGSFSLGGLTKRYCGVELDKGEESWRLRYALLDGVPPEEWPEEARRYALDDVNYTRAVDRAIPEDYPDEWFQVAAAFTLHLASCWGVVIDQPKLEWVEVALLTRIEDCERLLEEAGMFKDGSVIKAKVQAAVVAACDRLGKPVPRTEPTAKQIEKWKTKGGEEPKGQIRTNAETIEDLVAGLKEKYPEEAEKSPLPKFVELGGARKNYVTYIEPMKAAGVHAMLSRPNVLVASGRTSWGGSDLKEFNPWWPEGVKGKESRIGTNLQNFPQEAGVRDCIVARPGYVFSSTDYSALELRTLAQCLLWIVGYSTLANGFKKDPDWDPHSYLAAKLLKITYEEALCRKKLGKDDPEFDYTRKIAKNLNFALPGGVGAKKFQWMAKQAEIYLSLDECYYYKQEWLNAFPEMSKFFEYITWLTNNGKSFKQFVSERIRGDVGFCDGCNTGFQGLGADIAKYAFFLTSMECYAVPSSVLYRSRPVILVHDEIVAEHPIAVASEANMRVKAKMEEAEAHFLPDIPPLAEPTLTSHYTKAAKPKFKDGKLVVDLQVWDL